MNCGDIEENPGVLDQCYSNNNFVINAVLGVRKSNVLLETRLRKFNKIAVDVGGGGDCFIRAVAHQLYGNPNNYYLVRNLGIQYLMHNPEQFLESNTDYSWQGYFNNMSCQGT